MHARCANIEHKPPELTTKSLFRYSLPLLETVTPVLKIKRNDLTKNDLVLYIYFQSYSLQSWLLSLVTVTDTFSMGEL